MTIGHTMRKRLTLLVVCVALREGMPLIPPGTTVARIANMIEMIAGFGVSLLILLLLISLFSAFGNMNRVASAFMGLTLEQD